MNQSWISLLQTSTVGLVWIFESFQLEMQFLSWKEDFSLRENLCGPDRNTNAAQVNLFFLFKVLYRIKEVFFGVGNSVLSYECCTNIIHSGISIHSIFRLISIFIYIRTVNESNYKIWKFRLTTESFGQLN